jgi:hypothetical protein
MAAAKGKLPRSGSPRMIWRSPRRRQRSARRSAACRVRGGLGVKDRLPAAVVQEHGHHGCRTYPGRSEGAGAVRQRHRRSKLRRLPRRIRAVPQGLLDVLPVKIRVTQEFSWLKQTRENQPRGGGGRGCSQTDFGVFPCPRGEFTRGAPPFSVPSGPAPAPEVVE